MGSVPKTWKWLEDLEGLPGLVREGLKEYGRLEGSGTSNNSEILKWADEVAEADPTPYNNWADDFYNKDSIPWCGLFIALLMTRTGRKAVKSYLSALAWASWGEPVVYRLKGQNYWNRVWLGDIAVFTRAGGGHVAVVIGFSTDGKYVYVLGGNQSNSVNITKIESRRIYAIRRPKYTVVPAACKNYRLTTAGSVSKNEA